MKNDIILATIFFILGLIPAIYFYVKGKREKEPVYSIKSNNLVTGSISKFENLKVLYKDKDVENLTVSKILFFNKGAETITKNDLQTIHPLKFGSETSKVLDVSLIQVNNYPNNIQAFFDKGSEYTAIHFDYLGQYDGAVFQVIHTGLRSEDLEMHGAIIGAKKLNRINPTWFTTDKKHKTSIRSSIISLILTVVIWIAIIWTPILKMANESTILQLLLSVFGVVSIFVILNLGIVILEQIFYFFKISYSLPKGLEKFLE